MNIKELDEIIEFAIKKEQIAVSFYTRCSELAQRDEMKQVFLHMAKEEEKHVKVLEDFNPSDLTNNELESIPNLLISDYLVKKEFHPEMSYQDILILGMKREEKSYQFYTRLASENTKLEIRNLFSVLAREELKHKARLEQEYDDLVYQEN